jgi:hypothetical protein
MPWEKLSTWGVRQSRWKLVLALVAPVLERTATAWAREMVLG